MPRSHDAALEQRKDCVRVNISVHVNLALVLDRLVPTLAGKFTTRGAGEGDGRADSSLRSE
jgi:hypothetical protein